MKGLKGLLLLALLCVHCVAKKSAYDHVLTDDDAEDKSQSDQLEYTKEELEEKRKEMELERLLKQKAVEFTHNNLGNKMEDGNGWLVDFYAPWCGHCKNLDKEIDKLSINSDRKFKLGKVNCDENPMICGKMVIAHYPTIIFMYNNEEIKRFTGFPDAESLLEFGNAETAKITGTKPLQKKK